jgi:hypothetical protein
MHVLGRAMFATPREFLDNLADVAETAATRLGERESDGRKLVGFALPRDSFAENQHMLCHVWVDPKTRLPVRYEFLPEDPGDLSATFLHYTVTFTFHQPLDASLFRLSTPEGYTPFHWKGVYMPYVDLLPLPPQDKNLASPVVELGVGIGGAKFGMSLEKVFEVLGPPDIASDFHEYTPEEARERDEIDRKASQEADEKGLNRDEKFRFVMEAMQPFHAKIAKRHPNGMCLEYLSRGFMLYVLHDQGFIRAFCYGENTGMRPFTGKTSEGIGIGATRQEIERVYGPPLNQSELTASGDPSPSLYYKHLQTVFQLEDGRLWGLSLDKP